MNNICNINIWGLSAPPLVYRTLKNGDNTREGVNDKLREEHSDPNYLLSERFS
jgi:hypothetical protein